MEQKNKWSSAATNGLILSLVTIIYSLLGPVLGLKGFIMIIFWIIKTAGCIYLLYYFMKQYSSGFETLSYGESFNYGFILCGFSSIVCACFAFLSMTLLFPEQMAAGMEQVQQAFASRGLDSSQEEMMGKWMDRMPQLILFFTLIYYTLFGAAVSAIIANYTKKTNIFAGGQPDGE